MSSQQQAQEKSIEELGASVLNAKRRYAAVCGREGVSGLEDSELIALTIERQRAVQALVKAEAALSDAMPQGAGMSDLTSLQPIGDAHLLVEFEVETVNGKPNVTVNGAYGDGERGGFIEASCFSEGQLVRWECSIQNELLVAA